MLLQLDVSSCAPEERRKRGRVGTVITLYFVTFYTSRRGDLNVLLLEQHRVRQYGKGFDSLRALRILNISPQVKDSLLKLKLARFHVSTPAGWSFSGQQDSSAR
jgi:hypothetical protein